MKIIWVVEDEENIRELIGRYLEKEGYRVRLFTSAENMKAALVSSSPDLFILDIMLPGEDGLSLLTKIREAYSEPVVFVSARGEEFDRILGLELGGDDYLSKPFSPRELVVRVNNLFRRIEEPVSKNKVIRAGGLLIDTLKRAALAGGEELPLTAREFDLLALLAASFGRPLSRGQIIEQVWGYDFEGHERAVDDVIKRIRKKLRQKEAAPALVSVRGYGYKLDV